MISTLDDDARADLADSLPGWQRHPTRDAITRQFRFAGFTEAWAFMSGVALLAAAQDHHPEWSNVFNRVDILLTTHAVHGLSARDVRLARAKDAQHAGVAHPPRA